MILGQSYLIMTFRISKQMLYTICLVCYFLDALMNTKTPELVDTDPANTAAVTEFNEQIDTHSLTEHMQSASKQASQLLKSLSHPDRFASKTSCVTHWATSSRSP